MLPAGPELVATPQDFWKECSAARDVRGFGLMLYEIVTGLKAPVRDEEMIPPPPARIEGLEDIRSAALRLAIKCLERLSARPNMRQAAMEIRLLCLQVRRLEAQGKIVPAAPLAPVAEPEPEMKEERWIRVSAAEVA
jgi:hypothetical protein